VANSTLIVDYLGEGPAASRPASLPIAATALGIYFATDTGAVSYWNGTAWVSSGGSGAPVELASFVPGLPAPGLRVRFAIARALIVPAGATLSLAIARVAATGTPSVTVNHVVSGTATAIGSIAWAAAGTVGTFTFAAAVTFAAGDILEMLWPATADATLADVAVTWAATRE
jgi:hypothetical protein